MDLKSASPRIGGSQIFFTPLKDIGLLKFPLRRVLPLKNPQTPVLLKVVIRGEELEPI